MLANGHQRDRPHGIRMSWIDHPNTPLSIGQQVFVQRLVQHLQPGWPTPPDQSQIGLAGFALAKLILQRLQGTFLFGDQQKTAGFAIQPMNQFKETGVRARSAQLLNHPEADTAAPMHGHTRRLVQRQKRIVLMDNRKITPRHRKRRLLSCTFGQPDGGNAQHISSLHPVVCRNPALVAPHLPRTDDPIDVGLGNTLELPEQVVVQPLTGRVLVHKEMSHGPGTVRNWRIQGKNTIRPAPSPGAAPYNVSRQSRVVSD